MFTYIINGSFYSNALSQTFMGTYGKVIQYQDDRMGEASFCDKVRRCEGWLWLCCDEMFRLPGLPEALTFHANEPGQEFKFQNESMQRCRTRTECKINDNNMGTNETDQPHESARLRLCYIGESLIKKSKLQPESGAKVSIKFRTF